jgi:hypothetical protein
LNALPRDPALAGTLVIVDETLIPVDPASSLLRGEPLERFPIKCFFVQGRPMALSLA